MRQNIIRTLLICFLICLSGCAGESLAENMQDAVVEPEDDEETIGNPAPQRPLVATPSTIQRIDLVLVSEGMYCIFDGEKYGFMTEEGEEIASCVYDTAEPFHEGLACVSKEGKYGYIDVQGETALPFDYDYATAFVEGLAYFEAGDSYGFMDKTGTPVFYPECDSVSSF